MRTIVAKIRWNGQRNLLHIWKIIIIIIITGDDEQAQRVCGVGRGPGVRCDETEQGKK